MKKFLQFVIMFMITLAILVSLLIGSFIFSAIFAGLLFIAYRKFILAPRKLATEVDRINFEKTLDLQASIAMAQNSSCLLTSIKKCCYSRMGSHFELSH